MPKASTEAIKAFNEGLERCVKETDEGQSQFNAWCVLELVRKNKEAAYVATELKCILAQHLPNYLKRATFIAWAYEYLFKDDALITLVKNAANTAVAQGADKAEQAAVFVDQTLEELSDMVVRAGATAFINSMPKELTNLRVILPTREALPERARKAAQRWWQETGKAKAICDTCNAFMQSGEGYMISGRLSVILSSDGSKDVMDIGEELICEVCSKDILFSKEQRR